MNTPRAGMVDPHTPCGKPWLTLLVATALGLALAIVPSAVRAQSEADELAKALANPVAALISVPFQLNYDDGFGDDGDRWTLNIQPVIPVSIGQDWNLISRTILPLMSQDDVIGNSSQSGLGDTVQSIFFSPKAPTASGWIWGLGPVFLLPTATDHLLGTEKWGIGPTGVALKQTESGWTMGVLANHLVSFAGDDDRSDVEATFIQPFITRSLGGGQTLALNMESTYDWKSEKWNVPMNLVYTKVTKIGNQMISWGGGGRLYLDSPPGGADWGLRFLITLLYPR